MTRRGFFAAIAAAAAAGVAVPRERKIFSMVRIATAPAPFMYAPDYIADMDCWESPNAQPLVYLPFEPPPLMFHRDAFTFTWPPLYVNAEAPSSELATRAPRPAGWTYRAPHLPLRFEAWV